MENNQVTAMQLRMARSGLDLTAIELCNITGLHRNTLINLEKGNKGRKSTLMLLITMLEKEGVEFVDNGVIIHPKTAADTGITE